jgi:hypothetical protein
MELSFRATNGRTSYANKHPRSGSDPESFASSYEVMKSTAKHCRENAAYEGVLRFGDARGADLRMDSMALVRDCAKGKIMD